MSQDNVELVQQMVEAWNQGDYDAARECFDPDVEVEVAQGDVIDGTYFGHAGLVRLMRFWGSFRSFHSDIEKCIPAGDVVVTLLHHYGTGKRSSIDVDTRNWHVFTIRKRKIVRSGHFSTEAQALEAAGLSE